MKKIFIFMSLVLLLTGCMKAKEEDLINDVSNKIKSSKAYQLTGTLEIYRNEEKFTYDVISSFKKGDYYKVDLINKTNNHEQIILKNKESVYVITPSLNKSFKFQSEWPNNNSQIYLLQPILTDIKNDEDKKIEKVKEGYIITSKVYYSTERDFKKQKVYFDLNKNITKVEIIDSNGNVKMCLNVINIEYGKDFEKNYFDIEKYQSQSQNENGTQDNSSEEKETTSSESLQSSKIEEVLYPMYVPIDTYLTSQDVISTENGERVILTFSGESDFVFIQENLSNSESINYVYGDPYLILDNVGAITDYSVSWISNGIEYSVMSDTMSVDELLVVAQSVSVEPVSK